VEEGAVLCGGMFGDGVFFIWGGGMGDALWQAINYYLLGNINP